MRDRKGSYYTGIEAAIHQWIHLTSLIAAALLPAVLSVQGAEKGSPDPASTQKFKRYSYDISAPKPGNRAEALFKFTDALAAQRSGDLKSALTAYRTAIQLDPAFFEAQYNLGVAAYDAGQVTNALTAYETALALRPDSRDTRYNFALSLRAAGYPVDAAEELNKLMVANANESRVHFSLGNLYAQQLGQPKLAREHYQRVLALEPNHPQAATLRAWLATNPDSGPPSSGHLVSVERSGQTNAPCVDCGEFGEEQVRSKLAGAEKGDAVSQDSLGDYYYIGLYVTKDNVEAVNWFRKAAEQGNAEAQYHLGVCYAEGSGIAKDVGEAVKWYRKAAEQGHIVSQFILALCYEHGDGVTKDETESANWHRKATEQRSAKEHHALGVALDNGRGVPKNWAEAERWLTKAAEGGEAGAAIFLAFHYYESDEHKDVQKAMRWWRCASELGDQVSQYDLARILDGTSSRFPGTEKDTPEAAKWYKRAAMQGFSPAQFCLGQMHAHGKGVPQNDIEAYKWLSLAAADGLASAGRLRDQIAERMARAEIVQAQQLASAFVSRPERKSVESGRDIAITPGVREHPRASGTGFFISEDGFLVTNEHVVRDGAQVRIATATGLISANVVKVDAANDLALLKAEGRFAALPVAASRAMRLGGTVATVGFPNIGLQGFAPKLAKGEIASLSGAQDDARYFQISVPLQPGNSGGALVDERGNVVGVVAAKLNARAAFQSSGALPENVNYAVKSSYLLSFLESVPDVANKLKAPETKDRKFEDVVKSAEQAAVLVLVY